MNKALHILIPLLIIIVAMVVVQFMRGLNEPAQRRGQDAAVARVETFTAQPQTIRFDIKSRGTVKARQQSRISSEVSGRVTKITPSLVNGGFVRKGDKLLAIEDTDYRLQLKNAEADLLTAKLDLEDKQARFKPDTLIVQQSRARFAAAKQALAKSHEDLAKTRIHAPFNGVISNKAVDVGQFIQTGFTIADIAGTDYAEIRLPVTATDILHIAPELYAAPLDTDITLTASIGQRQINRQSRTASLEGLLDPQTRSYMLNVTLKDPYGLSQENVGAFANGMFVTAHIAAKPLADAVRLPLSALHEGNHVFLMHEGKLKKQAVEVVYRQANHAIVSKGLTEGDLIVTSRLDIMFDGMPATTESP